MRLLALTGSTAVVGLVVAGSGAYFGADSATFALIVVWAPMTWLGTISRIVPPRLPDAYHELRDVERSGRLYEAVGVKVAKWLLRRGPIAVFNPHLHLPRQQTPDRLADLDRRMRDAEASHAILLVGTTLVIVHAAYRGWWTAAALTTVFNLLLNGYPVMLQRYNRALLRARFPASATTSLRTAPALIGTSDPAPTHSADDARFGRRRRADASDHPAPSANEEHAT